MTATQARSTTTRPAPTPADPDLPARPVGPGALSWYATGDHRAFAFALRALVLQVAHPMVGAGVHAHSVYKTDPWGRLWRTSVSLVNQVYGGKRAAVEGPKLIARHTEIRGTDARGRRYHALDPSAYMWVHATMFDTWRLFLREVGPGLTVAEEERLFDEWHRMGLLIGVRPSALPATRAEFDQMWEHVVTDVLENNEVVQDLFFQSPRRPPGMPGAQWVLDLLSGPLLRHQREIVALHLPVALRERLGLPAPDARSRRRVRRAFALARLGNRLPDPLRLTPLAWSVARRTVRAGRTAPEPIHYPSGGHR